MRLLYLGFAAMVALLTFASTWSLQADESHLKAITLSSTSQVNKFVNDIPRGENISLTIQGLPNVAKAIDLISPKCRISELELREVQLSLPDASAIAKVGELKLLYLFKCKCGFDVLNALWAKPNEIKIYGSLGLDEQAATVLKSTQLTQISLLDTDLNVSYIDFRGVEDVSLASVDSSKCMPELLHPDAIKKLRLKGMHLETVDFSRFGQFSRLRHIEFANCELKGDFKYASTLKVLHISMCSCAALRIAPSGLSNLAIVNCHDNSGCPTIDDLLKSSVDTLRMLVLDRNGKVSCTLSNISKMACLRVLSVSGSEFPATEFAVVASMKNLESLALRDVGMKAENVASVLSKHLTYIDLSGNQIGDEGCAVLSTFSGVLSSAAVARTGLTRAGVLMIARREGLEFLTIARSDLSPTDISFVEDATDATIILQEDD